VSTLVIYTPLSIMAGNGIADYRLVEWLMSLQFGQTPPLVLALFAYWADDVKHLGQNESMGQVVMGSVVGVISWAVAVGLLWLLASARFAALTNRLRSFISVRRAPSRPAPLRRARPQPSADDVLDALPVAAADDDGAVDVLLVEEDLGDAEPSAERI
jgi:hypothetical protein